jgi:hypothetical protein
MNEDKVRRLSEELVAAVIGRPEVSTAEEYRAYQDRRDDFRGKLAQLIYRFAPRENSEDY